MKSFYVNYIPKSVVAKCQNLLYSIYIRKVLLTVRSFHSLMARIYRSAALILSNFGGEGKWALLRHSSGNVSFVFPFDPYAVCFWAFCVSVRVAGFVGNSPFSRFSWACCWLKFLRTWYTTDEKWPMLRNFFPTLINFPN